MAVEWSDVTGRPDVLTATPGSTSATLQAMVDATPSGGTLRIPLGNYTLTATMAVVDKSITVDATSATFIRTTTGPVFAASATVDVIHDVDSVTTTTIVDGSSDPGLVINLADSESATGWTKGDVVKLVSDDLIPGELPGSAGNERRLGQHLKVASVAAGTVTVYGELYDPMITNIRVARMKPEHKVTWKGGRFKTTGGSFGNLLFTNLVAPQVIEPEIGTDTGTGVVFYGCYKYVADRPRIIFAPNNASAAQFGYGVHDISSSYGVVEIEAHRGRHAFSTASNQVAVGSANLWTFGRSFAGRVTGIATDTASSAFDTHSGAAEMVFHDVTVERCFAAVGLRGRNNSAHNVTGRDLNILVWVFSQDTGTAEPDSWGHDINGVRGINIRSVNGAIQVDLNSTTGTREIRTTRIRNVTVDNHAGHVLYAKNATVDFDNSRSTAGESLLDYTATVFARNSVVNGRDVDADLRGNTTGDNLCFVRIYSDVADTSEVNITGGWRFTSGQVSRMDQLLRRGEAHELVHLDVDLDELPGKIVSGSTPADDAWAANSTINYRMRKAADSGSSTTLRLTDADVADPAKLRALGRSNSPILSLVVHLASGDASLGVMPPGWFYGQIAVVGRTETGAASRLIVENDNAKRIRTATGQSVYVMRSKSILLQWNGLYWCQAAIERAPRVVSVASSANPAINTDLVDQFNITAQSAAIASMTTNLTGTPRDGQSLDIRLKDNGISQAFALGAAFRAFVTVPAVTTAGKWVYLHSVYNAADSIWDVLDVKVQS